MRRTWRVSLVGRLFGLLFAACGAAIVAGVVATMFRVGVTANLLYGLLTGLIFIVWPTLTALRPSVTLTESELVVRNPLHTFRVPLRDIEGVEGGYGGLAVTTRGGGLVEAVGIQKSNAARWFGVRTRSDDVVAAILAQVKQAQKGSTGGRSGPSAEPRV